MKECQAHGCKKQIDDKYRFCFTHKNNLYVDNCKIHGKTKFRSGRCVHCRGLRRAVYRYKIGADGVGRIGRREVKRSSPEALIVSVLKHPNRRYASRFLQDIGSFSGVYGIFEKSKRTSNGLGACMYVGQSVNIERRIGQHKEQILEAKKHPGDAREMYRVLAMYDISELEFRCLYRVPPEVNARCENIDQLLYVLACLEQWGMDSYEPTLNLSAARITDLTRGR